MRPAPACRRFRPLPTSGRDADAYLAPNMQAKPSSTPGHPCPSPRRGSGPGTPPADGGGSAGSLLRRAWRVARQIFFGMTTFEWVRDLERERGETERLFLLVVFGDLVGLPLLPPYYTLRLLPYVLPVVHRWKRGLLRERDWTDLAGLIGGID